MLHLPLKLSHSAMVPIFMKKANTLARTALENAMGKKDSIAIYVNFQLTR